MKRCQHLYNSEDETWLLVCHRAPSTCPEHSTTFSHIVFWIRAFNIDHLTTEQHSAGKPWTQTFTWMPAETKHPHRSSTHLVEPSHPDDIGQCHCRHTNPLPNCQRSMRKSFQFPAGLITARIQTRLRYMGHDVGWGLWVTERPTVLLHDQCHLLICQCYLEVIRVFAKINEAADQSWFHCC